MSNIRHILDQAFDACTDSSASFLHTLTNTPELPLEIWKVCELIKVYLKLQIFLKLTLEMCMKGFDI